MKKIRLYQNTALSLGNSIELSKDNSHHLNKVLRFPDGKNITIFNGDGFDYDAKVQSLKKITSISIVSKLKNDSESKLNLTLAQGIAKGEKMDFLIQKAIELGVSSIIPMQQKIANHACEQSGRAVIVNICQPTLLSDLLSDQNHNGFVLHHRANISLTQMPEHSSATILIGPEGGLTNQEVADSTNAGFKPLLLGKRVLRTETASLVAIANMQLLWGS